jgi:hypothetical protein
VHRAADDKVGTEKERLRLPAEYCAVDTIVWSEGHDSEVRAKAMDNADVYYVLVRAMK